MKRGYLAAMQHVAIEDNPYPDIRGPRNYVTFSRAFRHAWDDGYRLAKADMARGDYDGWYPERIQGL